MRVMPRFQRTALNKSIGHHRENLAIILSGHVTLIIIELSIEFKVQAATKFSNELNYRLLEKWITNSS